MMLCGINEVTPGMVLGTEVADPRNADHLLLRPGVVLDATIVRSLKGRGVLQVWIEDTGTPEIDGAVASQLSAARLAVYTRLRADLRAASSRTITVASVQSYKQAVMSLITQAISSAAYAGMTDALFESSDLATHGVNVAYLSLLTGLHAEAYVISEQPRLPCTDSRDMTVVGLAGLLHDVGKTTLAKKTAALHEIHGGAAADLPDEYLQHCEAGRSVLESARVPARVVYAVLNHHQRYDGSGWPDVAEFTAGRVSGRLAGRKIHVVARIVAACNVLDNLLRDAEGAKRAGGAAAALQEFASSRFDGWFDPEIRRAVLRRIPPFAVGTSIRLSDGRRAVVAAPSMAEPCRPTVRVQESPRAAAAAGSESSTTSESIDLSARRDLTITHALGEDVTRYLYALPAGESAPAAAPTAAPTAA